MTYTLWTTPSMDTVIVKLAQLTGCRMIRKMLKVAGSNRTGNDSLT
jgi:hypothetical protein